MHLSLKTKCPLLVLPLVAASLLLLAHTTRSYSTLQRRLADFRTDIRQATLCGAFATAATRQVVETLNIAFAGEDEDQFEDAQRTAQETLSALIELVGGEDDSRAGEGLDDLLEIERLFLAAEPIMQEIIDLGRRGDRESALEVLEANLEPLVDGDLFVRVDARLLAEGHELAAGLHEIIGATGQMRFVGSDVADHLEQIEIDYRQTVLANRFLSSLNRQVAEYSSIVLADEATDELRSAQREAERTLRDWRAMATVELAESESHQLEVVEDQYARLGSLGDEILRLAEQGKADEGWERLEDEMEQLVDESMIPLVAQWLSEEEIELAEGMDDLAEHASRMARIVTVGEAFVVLLGIVTPWLLARKIVRPIVQLTEATENVGAGNLGRRVNIASHGEIDRLAATFNGMADRLQKSHEELEQRVLDRTAELQRALESAQAATIAKSEFLANMSHEIRTPMTAILGFAETIADNVTKPENVEAIATIRKNGDNLLGIINDILDVSKVEAGKMTVEQIAFKPCEIIAEVSSLMRVRVDAKGLTFNIEYIGAIPETIQNDPTRLRQILINLIGNSIKFTEDGAVRLVVRFVDPAKSDQAGNPTEPHMQFDVLDTGPGISDEQATMLFEPFSQADTSATRKFGGTGLGLAVSKRFAELLGGDITLVESEVGVGTHFRPTVTTGPHEGVRMLEKPMSATVVADTSDGVARALPSDLHGFRILLAEDGPDIQRLISFVLKKVGADVTIKENGELALDAVLAAHEEGRPFDVILMDMQMPVMDGYETTRQLRQKGYASPIIALTAHAMASDRQRCIDAGCDDYSTKPIDRKKLIEMIQEQLQRAAVPACAPQLDSEPIRCDSAIASRTTSD